MKDEEKEIEDCPFCGDKVEQLFDDCGGSWIEHKEKRKDGSMQKCILTGININTSSRTHAEWNTRKSSPALEKLEINAVVDFLDDYPIKSSLCFDITQHECGDLAEELCQSFGRPKQELEPLDEEEILNTLLEDYLKKRGYETASPKYKKEFNYRTRNIVKLICSKYGRPKSLSVEEIQDIIIKYVPYKKHEIQLAQAIKNAMARD